MSLTPDRVSKHLRRIAAKIDNSANPKSDLVKRDIGMVITAMTHEARIQRIASEIFRLALEEVEVGLWDTEEGKDVGLAIELAQKKQEAEDIEAALKLVKRKIDAFLQFLTKQGDEGGDQSPF